MGAKTPTLLRVQPHLRAALRGDLEAAGFAVVLSTSSDASCVVFTSGESRDALFELLLGWVAANRGAVVTVGGGVVVGASHAPRAA